MASTRAYFLVVAYIAIVPAVASAKVYISEVAWMGTADNANAEWIELYNDGSPADLEGWSLVAADGQPTIALHGTLEANAYALLERTSDDTVSSVTALVVYTGALGNTGEDLTLTDVSGATIDSVSGGADWELGGDNTTKDTLQRSGSPATGEWITAPATPGRGGAIESVRSEEGDEGETEVSTAKRTTSSKSTTKSTTVATEAANTKSVTPKLNPALTLEIGDDRTASVCAPVTFEAQTYSESGKELHLDTLTWNFGDGTTGEGRVVKHTYRYAGDYVVVTHATRGGVLDDITDDDRARVRVIEPSLSISHADSEYIEIFNTGTDEIDLSGFALAVGRTHFRIPSGTILLPEAQIRFPRGVTKLAAQEGVGVGVFYPNNTLAVLYGKPAQVAAGLLVGGVATTTELEMTGGESVEAFMEESAEQKDGMLLPDAGEVPAVAARVPESMSSELASVAEAYGLSEEGRGPTETDGGGFIWWLLGLVAVLGTATAAVLLIRREQAEIIQGYEVESDEVAER